MRGQTPKIRPAFTATEMVTAIAMVSMVMSAIGAVLVDNQRGWNQMYDSAFGEVVTDGHVARRTFDATVRKASTKRERLGTDGDDIELYYYNDPQTAVRLDRYAKFYKDGENLLVEYGELNAAGNPYINSNTVILADNVKGVNFSVAGVCVQMSLRLDDGSKSLLVMSSAIRHHD